MNVLNGAVVNVLNGSFVNVLGLTQVAYVGARVVVVWMALSVSKSVKKILLMNK